MKPNKFNIFVMVALGGVMACGPIARAQDNTAPATPPPTPGVGNGAPGPRVARGPGALLEKLNLTDEEKPKVTALLKEENTKLIALRKDTSVAREDRGPKIKEIREATNVKMKEILTPEQYTKWIEMRKPRLQGARPAAGAPLPVAPSTAPTEPK